MWSPRRCHRTLGIAAFALTLAAGLLIATPASATPAATTPAPAAPAPATSAASSASTPAHTPTPASTTVTAYPRPASYPASETYTMTVNGQNVPVIGYQGYDYAGFTMTGPVTISLTKLNHTTIGSYRISPEKLGLKGSINGDTLTFQLPSAAYLIVKVDGRHEIAIAADRPQATPPSPHGPGIYSVTDKKFARQSTPNDQTAAIQSAIDAASAYGTQHKRRGTVYIPDGVFPVANLLLKSNITVYLTPGAVLQAIPTKSLYTFQWHKDSQNRDITWWISTQYGSKNISITGRGTLDGNGMALANAGFGDNIMVPIATQNFTMDGLTVRESASWGITPVRSNNLTFTNLKMYNRFDMGEDDAIDVIESQHVLINNAIGIALDDPFSTKTWASDTDIAQSWPGTPEPLRDVTIEHTISWTYCYGYKVGQGTLQPQSDITIRDGVVYDAAVGIGVHHKYGTAPVSNVTFDNIDIEKLSYSNDNHRCWLAFFVQDGDGAGGGPIRNVTARDITVRDQGTTPSVLLGLSDGAAVTGTTLDHITMPGSTTPADSLEAMNILDRGFDSGTTILPNTQD